MSSFTSLSEIANSAINKAKSQQRIIAREIATDGETPWKLKKLENAEKQVKSASNYFIQAMEQDTKNAKTFLDSVTETLDKINEENKKKEEEEKAAEDAEKAAQNKGIDGDTQKTGESGVIVDVIIPSTVVSSNLSSDKDKEEQDESSVNVSA